MKSDNIYNSANPKDKPSAFQLTTSFVDTAHEVEQSERLAALAARQALIEKIKVNL